MANTRWEYTGAAKIRLGTRPLVPGERFTADDALARQLSRMPKLFKKIEKKKSKGMGEVKPDGKI